MTMYDRVRRLCNSQGIDISNLGQYLPDANVSKSTISGWKKGATPRAGIVKSIADYFDVSPDYIAHGNKTPGVPSDVICVPSDSSPVAIIDGNKRKLSEQEVAVLRLCRDLDVVQTAKLIAYASELGN